MNRYLNYCFLLILSFMITACGFHFRNLNELPLAFHSLYLKCDNPDDQVAVGLKETLAALHVKLVALPEQAPYTLHLAQSTSSSTQPSISDITLATTVSFTQSISVSIVNNKTHKILSQNTFTETVIQTLNENQISTNSTATLGNQDLPRRLINDIYLWLTTKQVTHALYAKKQVVPTVSVKR